METPFLGGSYVSLSSNLANDRCMNLYPEVVETKEGKRVGGFYSTPGLRQWLTLGPGTVRGLHAAWAQNKLVTVVGNTVYTIDQFGHQATLGALNTSQGPVGILSNGAQVFVADGLNGWVWSNQTWSKTSLAKPVAVAFQDGFGLVNSAGTNQFYQSAVGDLSSWPGLNFSSADAEPSAIVGMIDLFRQVWLFKQKSVEVWNNAGLNGFAFQRMQGAFLETGCAAAYSIAKTENRIFWLGQGERGQGVVYGTHGYQAQRVSTHAIEYAIASYTTISDAQAFCYQQAGHWFYVLNFPTAQATWVFDESTGLWHERGEWMQNEYVMHDGICHANWQGLHLVGSSTQPVIYQYDLTHGTDDIASPTINPKRWLRRWRASQKPLTTPTRFPALQIDMQTGMAVGNWHA